MRTMGFMTPEHINALKHNTALVVETMRLREAGHDIPELSFDDPRLIKIKTVANRALAEQQLDRERHVDDEGLIRGALAAGAILPLVGLPQPIAGPANLLPMRRAPMMRASNSIRATNGLPSSISSIRAPSLSSVTSVAGSVIAIVGAVFAIINISEYVIKEARKVLNRESFSDWQAKKLVFFDKHPPVPKQFHDDPVLRSAICPLTLQPIRIPVTGQDGVVYEKTAIVMWIKNNPISPSYIKSNIRMTCDDLNPCYAMQRTIEMRLDVLESAIE